MTKAELVEELRALDSVVAYFTFDRNGVVRSVNARGADLVGLERRALVGKPFARLLAPGDAERFADHVARAAAGEGRQSVDLGVRAGSRTLHLRLESALADGAGGEAAVVRSTAIDDTGRKQLEDQLLHAQRMEAIGRLAGGIAHDFNNLLMTILGHGELLLLRLGQGDPMRASVETIQATAERAAALTRQLVTFSRRQVVEPKVLDLNAVIRDMDKILRRLIGEDVELEYALDPALGRVRVDPAQAEQVIMNLAVNARDAMPSGGRLRVATSNAEAGEARPGARPGPHVALSVTDTGVGMDDETKARIFEPFFTTKGVGKGTGLGLSTVHGIVEQAGGHLHVESVVGEGTTFTVRFPQVEGPVAERRSAATIDAPGGTETVLVVEDEDTVRELVCEMLRVKGYRVIEARHGGEALLLCEQRRRGEIDLMVTDVVMPQMSGRQLAERLAPLQPDMKVLFMSGHTDDAVIRHGVANAIMTLIQKPFTPAALAHKVRAMLDG